MSKLFKTLLLLVVLVAAAAGLYALTRGNKSGEGENKIVTVEKGSITEKALAVGQIQPRQKFSIKSKISGLVKRCLVNVGDKVKPGDPLFEIGPDPTPQELTDVDRQLDSTRASYERARSEFERSQQLSKEGVLPKSDMDVKREAFELARVAVAKAEQQRDLTRKGRSSTEGIDMESIIRAPRRHRSRAARQPGRPRRAADLVPGGHRAHQPRGHERPHLQGHGRRDRRRQAARGHARPHQDRRPADRRRHREGLAISPKAKQKEGATLFDVEIELQPTTNIVLRAGYSANADLIIREKQDVPAAAGAARHLRGRRKKSLSSCREGQPKEPPARRCVKLGLSDGMNVEVADGPREKEPVVERPPKKITSAVD